MGYDLVRGEDKLFKRLEQFQNGLLITNILLMIIALANFSVCIWVRYQKLPQFWYSNVIHLFISGLTLTSGNGSLKLVGTGTGMSCTL